MDDRKMGPGAKLKDAELLGFPYAIVVGRSFENDGQVELRCRQTGESWTMSPEDAVAQVSSKVAEERPGLESDRR